MKKLKEYDRMTAGQLRLGLERMPRPCPAALLFALEMKLTAEQTICLTRDQVKKLPPLTDYALHILKSQPVHIASKYVFWLTAANDKPAPMFGFESLVIDTYGLPWDELIEAYANLIWVDEFADAEDFTAQMR